MSGCRWSVSKGAEAERGAGFLGHPAEPLVVAAPVEEGGVGAAEPDLAHPSDDDGVRVPLDQLFQLAIERGQCAFEQRRSGAAFVPPRFGIAGGALLAVAAGEAVGDLLLRGGQEVHAEAAMALQ